MRGQNIGHALTGNAVAWYAALPLRRRQVAQDTALALTLAVLNLLSLLPYQSQMHPLWLALFLVSAQCLPLAVRRLWPVPALICCGVPRNLYDALAFGFAPLPLAPAIAFATVAERSRPWLRRVTVCATCAGIVFGQLTPGHTEPYDAIVQVFIFGAAWGVGTLSRLRRESMAAVSRRAERAESELDAAVSSAASAERLRIARELHDVVAHHVSLMAVQAEAVGALLPSRPVEAARSADLIAATARQAMTELRRLLGVLRFNASGFPASDQDQHQSSEERARLTPAPSITRLDEVFAFMREAGLPVVSHVSGSPTALSPGVDLTAYRIVQEALTNALRHAPGSTACVDVAYEADCVTVRVTDTGPVPVVVPSAAARPAAPGGTAGWVRASGRLAHGYGLAGIAERVASCGGTLTLGPVAPGGFAVTARLPLT
jgi:signal transduction histidine kinase